MIPFWLPQDATEVPNPCAHDTPTLKAQSNMAISGGFINTDNVLDTNHFFNGSSVHGTFQQQHSGYEDDSNKNSGNWTYFATNSLALGRNVDHGTGTNREGGFSSEWRNNETHLQSVTYHDWSERESGSGGFHNFSFGTRNYFLG